MCARWRELVNACEVNAHLIRVPTMLWYWNPSTLRTTKLLFKDQFSTEVYSMDSITAIFTICVITGVWIDKNMTISKSCFRQNTYLMKLLISHSLTWWIQGLSRTCGMKFKDFQAPVLFSSTFKALNLGEKKFKYFQTLSRMCGNPADGMLAKPWRRLFLAIYTLSTILCAA